MELNYFYFDEHCEELKCTQKYTVRYGVVARTNLLLLAQF